MPESYKRNSREKSVTASEEGGGKDKKVDSDSDEDVPLVKVKEERVRIFIDAPSLVRIVDAPSLVRIVDRFSFLDTFLILVFKCLCVN